MTKEDKDSPLELDLDGDLGWDDALSAWESDLDRALSEPPPGAGTDKLNVSVSTAAGDLPSPMEDLAAPKLPPAVSLKELKGDSLPSVLEQDSFDDEQTAMQSVPDLDELLGLAPPAEALSSDGTEAQNETPTAPPPPNTDDDSPHGRATAPPPEDDDPIIEYDTNDGDDEEFDFDEEDFPGLDLEREEAGEAAFPSDAPTTNVELGPESVAPPPPAAPESVTAEAPTVPPPGPATVSPEPVTVSPEPATVPPPPPPPPPPAAPSVGPTVPAAVPPPPPPRAVALRRASSTPPPVPQRASSTPPAFSQEAQGNAALDALSVGGTGPDLGALAAQRTVHYRKPRAEQFALVGQDRNALEARREMLNGILGRTEEKKKPGRRGDPVRARLLVAIAELSERLGDADGNRALYKAAREVDSNDLMSLRRLRREAVLSGDFSEAAELLKAETRLPLAVHERASAHLFLAELQARKLNDASGAAKSARHAMTAGKSVAGAMLLAELGQRQNRIADVTTSLERGAAEWNDPRVESVLICYLARQAEQRGQDEKARGLYERSLAARPTVEGLIGAARCARQGNDLPDVALKLTQLAEMLGHSSLKETVTRAAARVVHLGLNKPGEAAVLLIGVKSAAGHRAAAAAHRDSESSDGRVEALERWAASAEGTDRAAALVELAKARAELGDLDGADRALTDASLADNSLGTVRVTRELVARRAGDTSRLASAVSSMGGGALTAAGKVALVGGSSDQEWELLDAARSDDEAPATADVLALDLAAERADEIGVTDGLRREAERTSGSLRVAALLALSDRSAQSGEFSEAEQFLETAREVAPGQPVVLRPLGRVRAAHSPGDAANQWLEEAESAIEQRAAFAATTAALLRQLDSGDAKEALLGALRQAPNYPPAIWALEPIARRDGDTELLADLNERQLAGVTAPTVRAGHLVRAALARAGTDPAAAVRLLEQAHTETPHDVVLTELMLRLGDALPPARRGELLEKGAEVATGDLLRSSLLRAAGAFEDADQPKRAAQLYRRVLEANAEAEGRSEDSNGESIGRGDPIARRALGRAELAAGEVANVAARRFRSVKEAQNDTEKVRALAALADLDLNQNHDPGSAMLSLQSILEIAPGHAPSLRALERYFMEQDRDADLAGIQAGLTEHLGSRGERAAHLRVAERLTRNLEEGPEAVRDLLITHGENVFPTLWLARKLLTASQGRDPAAAARAYQLIRERVAHASEQAAATLGAYRCLKKQAQNAEAMELLAEAAQKHPEYPLVLETFADELEKAGAIRDSALNLGRAAAQAAVPSHQARLWFRAGVLYQESLGDPAAAQEAFARTAEVNIVHEDVFGRLRAILLEKGDLAELSRITDLRIRAGGEPGVMAELHTTQAGLREQLGDADGARRSLRAVLTLEPEHAEALHKLAELSLAAEDWRAAAEALIRIARVRKEREELMWVFSTLGEIYDRHMPDAQRAEAAYRRVLKLEPNDSVVLERLAALYQRTQNATGGAEVLARLVELEPDPERSRDFRIQLAEIFEASGDARRAEEAMEQARRNAPVDPLILKAMLSFYERQDARSAISMHLSRAVNDFRHALRTDPSDTAAWLGLTEVFDWRGRPDAGSVVASVGQAFGVTAEGLRARTDQVGAAPGARGAAVSPNLDEELSPVGLARVTRAVFQMANEALEKALPFEVKSIRAEKLSSRNNPFAAVLQTVLPWFDFKDVVVYHTKHAPRVCVTIGNSPVTLLIGDQILSDAPPDEQAFLVIRALKVAQAGLAVAVRSQPAQLAVVLAGLVRSYDPTFAPPGIDPGQLDQATKRMSKFVHKKIRDDLAPLVLEMVGSQGFDPLTLGLKASEMGDRAALLATGACPSAVRALLRLAGADPSALAPHMLAERIRAVAEAGDLTDFALSDAHLDLRERLK